MSSSIVKREWARISSVHMPRGHLGCVFTDVRFSEASSISTHITLLLYTRLSSFLLLSGIVPRHSTNGVELTLTARVIAAAATCEGLRSRYVLEQRMVRQNTRAS